MKRVLAGFGALLATALALAPAARAGAAPRLLSVAPNGTGTACSPASPCSIASAQQRVRSLAPAMESDIVVQLAGGTYRLTAPLTFGAADSGTHGHQVVYRAAPGARPVLDGGVPVRGWRLSDPANGIWAAKVPAGLQTREFYVNGQRVPRTSGKPTVTLVQTSDGYIDPSGTLAMWRNPSDIEFVFNMANGFWTEPRCDVQSISSTMITLRQPCWSNMHIPDGPAAGAGTDDNPMGGFEGISPITQPSAIENAYEELAPGTWYLDRSAATLYYDPPAGQDPRTVNAEVPVLQTLVDAQGTIDRPVHDLVFQGLTFADSTWLRPSGNDGFAEMQANFTLTGPNAAATEGTCQYSDPPGTCPFAGWTKTPAAVNFHAADRISLVGDTFTRLGSAGLGFEFASHDNLVQGNDFFDISGSGIQLGDTHDPQPSFVGADDREIVTGNRVIDNHIHDIGAEYHGGVGIWVGYTRHTTVTHNQLDHLPYTGISVGWGGWHTETFRPDNPSIASDNVVSNNVIYTVMQVLADGGAIYTNGWQGPGSLIDHGLTMAGNVAYNLGYGEFAYYNDEGSNDIRLLGNVEYRAPVQANGGCNTAGHIRIDGNYWAQTFGGYICPPPPIDVTVTNPHVISDHPGPADIPSSLLGSAGLEPAYAGLVTAAVPEVAGLGPLAGTAGTDVLVSGSGFDRSTQVHFGTIAASAVRVISPNYLVATVPAGAVGPVDVTVTNRAGTSPTSTNDLFAAG